MPKKRKKAAQALTAEVRNGRSSRTVVALCLLLCPLALLWRGLADQAVFPAGFMSAMAPWGATSSAHPMWNALLWDSLGQYFPWRQFAAEAFRGGQIPLWNPYQFCGNPFLANGQSALFYPLNLVFWLTDIRRAFGISVLLHLVLAGWFTYLYLRALRLRRLGAVVGAVAFALNGYFITWIYLPTVVNSAIWLPLALLFTEKFFRKGKWLFAAAAGGAIGLSALAGHPQIFLLCTSFFVIYFALRAVTSRQWLKLAVGLPLAGGVALGLSAVQLLPLIELLGLSHRASAAPSQGYAFYLSWALPWQNLVTLFAPDFYGNPTLGTFWGKGNYAEYCAYAGILPLLLAGLAAVFCKGFHARFFAVSAVVLLLCAFGTLLNWPLYHLVPGMSRAGSPSRLLLLYLSSIAFLAGLGTDWILLKLQENRVRWLRARLLVGVLGFALIAMGFAFLAKATVDALPEMNLYEAFADAKPNFAVLVGICLLAVIMILALGEKKSGLQKALPVILVVAIAADLLFFGQRYLSFSPREEVYPSCEVVEFLRQNSGGGRILALSPAPLEKAWAASEFPRAVYLFRGLREFPKALLPPNAASAYGVRDILGYDSLYLAEYRGMLGELEGRDPSPAYNGNLLLAANDNLRRDLLWLFGVRYLVSTTPLEGDNLWLVYEGEAFVYEVIGAQPRAWAANVSADKIAASRVEIVEDEINHVAIEADLSEAGKLVLADGYYPGWTALVDDKEVEIECANRAFRAVPLATGKQRIDFYYRPAAFKIGLFGFLLTISFAATIAVYSVKKSLEDREQKKAS